jgi:hypothetical protein
VTSHVQHGSCAPFYSARRRPGRWLALFVLAVVVACGSTDHRNLRGPEDQAAAGTGQGGTAGRGGSSAGHGSAGHGRAGAETTGQAG